MMFAYRTGSTALVLSTAALVLAGCSSNKQPDPAPDWDICREAATDPASLGRLGSVKGDYEIELTALAGERTGETTRGQLTLLPRDSVGVPYYGWTDLQLDAVGAHRLGDPGSRDRSAPGVLVLTGPDTADPAGAGSVTLRIGSQANRSDIIRFDGAYTALYVRWVVDGGFGGEWASGVTAPEAEGEFCALKTTSR